MAWLMIPFMVMACFLVLFIVLLPFVLAAFILDEYQMSKRNKKAAKQDLARLMARLESKKQVF